VIVEFRIDADDRVVWVDQGWRDFALANDAPELVTPPPDRTLWSWLEGDESRQLWRLLVDRVRALDQPVHVPFRCDGPRVRRWFDMAVQPEPEGAVGFRSVLVREQPRDPVPLLAVDVRRDPSAPMVRVCSWCCRCFDGRRWVEVEDLVRERRLLEPPLPRLTHGICPACDQQVMAELDRA
jgi:hypothetical protein